MGLADYPVRLVPPASPSVIAMTNSHHPGQEPEGAASQGSTPSVPGFTGRPPGTGTSISRRFALQLLTAGAAGVPLSMAVGGVASAGPAARLEVPQTLSATVTGPGGGTSGTAAASGTAAGALGTVVSGGAWTTARPGFAIRHVALGWAGGVAPRLRPISDSGRAGDWQQAADAGCAVSRDGEHPHPRALVAMPRSTVAVDLDLPPAARAVLLNTGDGTPRRYSELPRDRVRTVAGSSYLSRGRWGADESLRFNGDGTEKWVPAYYPVQTVTVHHTATEVDPVDPAVTVRAIYHYHAVEQGWGDIGYHFLIDPAGRIYEGRYSGSDPAPAFDPSLQVVTAGHVGGYNSGNVGIALLGDLTAAQPSEHAHLSLLTLLWAICFLHKIDPLAEVTYRNPVNGVTAKVRGISGHRDWPTPTECPGDAFYPTLAWLRAAVAQRLGSARNAPDRLVQGL